MNRDRILRALVPSVPVLARTPLVFLLDTADYFLKKNHPEWSKLPPASFRMRIGVGNRILRNHQVFIDSGNAIVSELSVKGYLTPHSHVLELGCGCGRNAFALSRFIHNNGTYAGLDVDREMILWCQKQIQSDRVTFHHADIYSKVYNPAGRKMNDYSFPASDGSTTLIISVSLFSHLLSQDFQHYIHESSRVLSKGSYLHMTLFLLDYIRGRLGDRWTFAHKMDACYVNSVRYPEAAVAYELDTVKAFLSAYNLSIVEIYNEHLHQQTLIAQKQ